MSEDRIPPWMLCVDMLNKIKRELVTQAIDTLDREVEAGRMDIKGSIVAVPDQSTEIETKLFVIGRMLENVDEMRHKYSEYMRGIEFKGNSASSAEIENYDRAKKFLLAIEKISTLVHYSNMLDGWINDASMLVGATDVLSILKETSKGKDRAELLGFLLKNKTIESEETLTADERRVIDQAFTQRLA